MTHFALDALQANKGDALVLRWGTDASPHTVLIDGGTDNVWDRAIEPHLRSLAGTDPTGKQNPVVLERVVVSHVDEDHIQGIIDMANAIDSAQKQANALPALVAEVWHNAFGDMEFLTEFSNDPDLVQAIQDANVNPASLVPAGVTPRNDPTIGDIAAGAQSVKQGRTLDQILHTIRLPRNTSFADRGDFVRDGAPLTIEGLQCTVIAPNTDLLKKLRDKWKQELPAILRNEADKRKAGVSALAAAFDDRSVPNQSSIVLLVEFANKTMLLTGDARGDHLIDALDAAGFSDPLHVDLFKVGHHCSIHSNGTKLFQRVTADHYVISGNGEHGNPHADALTALFQTQAGRPITLHLTNRPSDGAIRAEDVVKAANAQAVLDTAESDPNVTILYRNTNDLAITVDLI